MKWTIKNTAFAPEDILPKLLESRGLDASFLENVPVEEYLRNLDSEYKQSLVDARSLIKKCIEDDFNILVFGDYDVDGVCATSILYSVIKDELEYKNVYYFIPNRFDHGYGMSEKALEQCISDHKLDENTLVITVDTGITAAKEVSFLKGKGMKVIVTDHHQKPDSVPESDVLVWNDSGTGAAIAYALARGLGTKNTDLLVFAGLATITDLVPVLGLNRALVREGLEIMNSDRAPQSLKTILEIAGRKDAAVTEYDFGWVIGPRLNASGRLIDAKESMELLLAKDKKVAEVQAQKLEEINRTRQDKTQSMYDFAGDSSTDLTEEDAPKIIFSQSEDFHEGVIGLVASKLVQKYNRPAIVMSVENGLAKGSVRSIKGVNIIEMLRKFDDLFESLGGHPMAAGFSILTEKLEILEKKLLSHARENIPDELLVPEMEIDLEIPLEMVNLDVLEEVEKLKPFGVGNSRPVFASNKVQVTGVRNVGRENQHLLLQFLVGKNFQKGIMFGGVEQFGDLSPGSVVDIAYTINKNEFNGKIDVDLQIRDININE